MVEEFIELGVDIWSNPAGKIGLGTSIVLSFYKTALSKSKEVNAVLRTKAREQAKLFHHKHCKKILSRKLVLLSTKLWKMIELYADDNKGKRIQIKQGSKTLDHIPSVFQRDYYEESRKILFEIKRKQILEDFHGKANKFVSAEDRENYLDSYASDFRELFLGSVHKSVAGYNSDVEKYEDEHITYEYLRKMFGELLQEFEVSYNIKVSNERKAERKYSVNRFDMLKVLKSFNKGAK